VEQRLVLSALRRGSRLRTLNSSTPILPSKSNFGTVFAGQAVGIKEVQDDIWLVSFMDHDLGYFDVETRVLEPLEKAWEFLGADSTDELPHEFLGSNSNVVN
jgi:hypothetical protein